MGLDHQTDHSHTLRSSTCKVQRSVHWPKRSVLRARITPPADRLGSVSRLRRPASPHAQLSHLCACAQVRRTAGGYIPTTSWPGGAGRICDVSHPRFCVSFPSAAVATARTGEAGPVSTQAPNGARRAVGTHHGPTRIHGPTTAYAIGGTATLVLRYSIISATAAARTLPPG